MQDMQETLSFQVSLVYKLPTKISEIAAAAKEQLGYDIDKKKISVNEAIKSLGVHNVKIKLHPKVTAELKVKVTEK